MMGRRTVLGILAGAASAALTGCGLFMSSASFRYRMTVEVDTPQGTKKGYVVREIDMAKAVALTAQESAYSGGERGEAVIVDLTDGPVFVLLANGRDASGISGQVTRALAGRTTQPGKDHLAAVKQLSGSAGVKAELPREQWPMMVRFRDLSDPKSVERVEPATVGVTRILLETTDDAVTTGIEKRMPVWFGQQIVNRTQLSGKSSSIISTNELADNLGPGNFGTEIGK